MLKPALALVMTLLPGVAAAQVAVDVQVRTPRVQVAVGTPPHGPQGPSPGPGYVWQPAGWVVDQNGNRVYQPGHWRPVPVAAPVVYEPAVYEPAVIETAPPEQIVEIRPAAPYAHAVWIPGYWHWQHRRHVWVGGRWSAPRPGYVWEPHRWVRRGHDHRWAWQSGQWRRYDGRHDTWRGRPADRRDGRWDHHDRDRDRDHDRNRGHRHGHHKHGRDR